MSGISASTGTRRYRRTRSLVTAEVLWLMMATIVAVLIVLTAFAITDFIQ